jgi:hypothetical protein
LLRTIGRLCRAVLLGTILLVSGRGAARAQSSVPASECCLVLLFPVGARAVALGQSLVTAGSSDALFVNPAGLAWMNRGQFVVHHGTVAQAQMDALSLLFTPKGIGTIGITYHLFDEGESPGTDPDGNPTGTLSTREQLLILSFATPVVAGVTAGLNYKLYQFRNDCAGNCAASQFVGTTSEIDVGLQYRAHGPRGLRLGVAVNNAGLKLQVINIEQADPPPTRLRAGASYEVMQHFRPDTTTELWVTAQADARLRGGAGLVPSLGVELSVNKTIFLMTGFRGGSGLNTGLAVGVGLQYQRFFIAVAKAFSTSSINPQGEPPQLTFAISS